LPEYTIRLRPLTDEEGGGWLAEVPDLPGCMSDGETPEEAAHNVQDAIQEWMAAAREMGREIPSPSTEGDKVDPRLIAGAQHAASPGGTDTAGEPRALGGHLF